MDDYRYCEATAGAIHWYRRTGRWRYESACGLIRRGKRPGGYVGHARECPACIRALNPASEHTE